ncbi:MAG TPA: sugar phosphate nucleotidyltransferase [Candidatus Dormibacteraeota bacterium]|nr:sugar phosphate nucleotidyltransferase [Candidatus Dormibacteraeota bacterium]
MKGVILAGGTGSRLHPLTRITNKHLLPIYDRPMISYAIEALVKSGVTEMMLVTGGTHAGEFLRLLGNGQEFGIKRLLYAYQDKPGGIAEALGLAENFVGREKVVVLLADNIFGKCLRASVKAFQKQKTGARVILYPESDKAHLRSLGVAQFQGDGLIGRIVEKPAQPPSQFAVTGVYFYDASVWKVLPALKPSKRGELEITDVNNWYVKRNLMQHDVLDAFWGDAGESIDAYYAVNDYVREHGANLD